MLAFGVVSLVGSLINPPPQTPNGGMEYTLGRLTGIALMVAFVFFGRRLRKNNREP